MTQLEHCTWRLKQQRRNLLGTPSSRRCSALKEQGLLQLAWCAWTRGPNMLTAFGRHVKLLAWIARVFGGRCVHRIHWSKNIRRRRCSDIGDSNPPKSVTYLTLFQHDIRARPLHCRTSSLVDVRHLNIQRLLVPIARLAVTDETHHPSRRDSR